MSSNFQRTFPDLSVIVPLLLLFLCSSFPNLIDRLWSDECRWQNVGLEVRRRMAEGRIPMLLWPCLDVFVIPPISRPEGLLFSLMVSIDFWKDPGWLLVPIPPVLTFFSSLILSGGAAVRPGTQISQVELAVMTTLRFPNWALCSVDHDFG